MASAAHYMIDSGLRGSGEAPLRLATGKGAETGAAGETLAPVAGIRFFGHAVPPPPSATTPRADYNGATGTVPREYVWIGDLPVAVIDSTSGKAQTYAIHTGPVDEPLELTSAAKALVWNAYVNPFGWAQTFGTAQAGIDLRLPGQWTELETNSLSQNGYRDYDPSFARYIEADPLGVDAGQNLYAYVDGDPLNRRDPTGLLGIPDAIAGAVAGGVGGYLTSGNWKGAAEGAALGFINPIPSDEVEGAHADHRPHR